MKRPIYLTLASAMAFFAIMSLMLALSSFTYAIDGPPLNCKSSHVIAINDETVFLFPDSLVNGREESVTLQLRRMPNSYIVASDTLPSDSITIGCADVGRPLLIEVIATEGDSSTRCMVTVTVQNKLPIMLMAILPDITISCGDFKALNGNYSSLGTYVDEPANIQSHTVGDFEFRDGLVGRICDDVIVRTSVKDSTMCGFGKLVRVFTITAPGADSTLVLEQEILIFNEDPFSIEDITLTRDTTVMGCFKGTLPDNLGGKPQYNLRDKCAMVVANKSDMVFNDPTSGCPFVMRTWKIMDMCTFTPDKLNGYWEIVQNIYIMDTVAPKFMSPCVDTTIINYDGSCTIPVNLSAKAKDNCTNDKDLIYSYKVTKGEEIILQGNTPTFSLNFVTGIYNVEWTVDDRCGNTAKCVYKLRTSEGKKPTPVLIPGIVANLPMACDVVFDANIFNKGSYDNCTPKDQLIYSFSPDIEDDTLVMNCSHIGTQSVLIYVTDQAGNQNQVSVSIEIQDLSGHCPANKPLIISGQVMTEDEMYVPEVEVKLEGAEQTKMVKTDDHGRFVIGELARYSDYELRASKETDFRAGINVLDLLAIQKHILGLSKLSDGFRMIAADVDGSEDIDLKDLIDLRKIVLGIKNPEADMHSWRFIPNTSKNASTQPWPINDMAFYDNLENDIFLDFKAIKIGDVNGSISKSLKGRNDQTAVLLANDITFKAGDIVEVPIYMPDFDAANGLQLAVLVDRGVLKFQEVKSGVFKEGYHEKDGYINLLTYETNGLKVSKGEAITVLAFKALKDGSLSSAMTQSAMDFEGVLVDSKGESFELQFNIIQNTGNVMDVRQNIPNPFNDHTLVFFELGSDLPVEFSLYDQSGKLLFHDYKPYAKGKHQLYLDDTQFKGATGVMFLHVETAEVSEIKKLLRLK